MAHLITNCCKEFKKVICCTSNNFVNLKIAIEKDNFEEFFRLIDSKKVSIQDYEEDTGNNPLHLAVKASRYYFVEYILSKVPGLEKEDKNFDGDSALMLAVLCSDLRMVKILVEKADADINAKESEGFTVFIAACANGKLDIVDYFLAQPSCNVYSKNYSGQTALHRAAFYGEIKIIRLLMTKTKLSLSQKDSRGNGCLHFAAMRLNMTCYRYILKKLGDQGEGEQKKKNQEGLNPVQLLIKSFNMIRKDDKAISEQDVLAYIRDRNVPPPNLYDLFKDQQQKPTAFTLPEKLNPNMNQLGILQPLRPPTEPPIHNPEQMLLLQNPEEIPVPVTSKAILEDSNKDKPIRQGSRFIFKSDLGEPPVIRPNEQMKELNLLRPTKSPIQGVEMRTLGSPLNGGENFEFSTNQLRKSDTKDGIVQSEENNLLKSKKNLQGFKLTSMVNAFKKKLL